MELMNEKTTITGAIPKIVETPDHFIMNSQLYEKQTLKPLPMKFAIPMNTGYNDIVLNTSVQDMYLTHFSDTTCIRQCQRIGNYRNIIRDKFDPNLFFIITKYNSYDHQMIIRLRQNSDGYTIEQILTDIGNQEWGHKEDFKILFETDTDFVYEQHYDYASHHIKDHGYTGCGIGKMNKKTFTRTYYQRSDRWYTSQSYCLESFNDIGYILKSNLNTFYIYKINTSANTFQQIGSTLIIPSGKTVTSNPIKIGDCYYFLADNYDAANNYHQYAFIKLKLDTNTDTYEYEFIKIPNYLDFEMDSTGAGTLNISECVWHQLQPFEANGNTYVSCTIYAGYSGSNNSAFKHQHKHVLFKMTDNGFRILHIERFTDGCKGVLFVNDDYKKPVFVTVNSCLFYTFDEDSEIIVNTHKIGGVFKVVGFDTLGRFIMMHKDNTVDILTDTNASTLLADFDQELYNKDNTSEIDTTVSFYAKNFLDEFLETSVTLTLSGPVVFKENGEKTLKISTLKTGVRTVPVVITGYGSIEVIITQNT